MEDSTTVFPVILDSNGEDVTLPAPKPVTERPCIYYCDMDFMTGKKILWVFNVIILPTIGIFGMFGNISSILVLKRQGMNKSSNILLMAMAFSDICYLIGCNNTYHIWRSHYKSKIDYQAGFNWYAVGATHNFCMELGNAMSIFLVVAVTVERLVAVYFPLKFTTIIRPHRTRVAIVVIFLFALAKAIIGNLRLSWRYNSAKKLPAMKKSLFYFEHQEFFDTVATAYDYVIGFIPVLTVCTGSILIGIKIFHAATARAKMLSYKGGENNGNQKPPTRSSRTTKTLLSVCIMFTCTVGVGFGIETFMPFSITYRFYIVEDRFTLTLYALNSSCNFIIYVLMNKNFRDTYISILMPWKADQTKPGLSRTLTMS